MRWHLCNNSNHLNINSPLLQTTFQLFHGALPPLSIDPHHTFISFAKRSFPKFVLKCNIWPRKFKPISANPKHSLEDNYQYCCFGFNLLNLNKLHFLEIKPHRLSWFSYRPSILVDLKFGNIGFCGGRKTRELGEKPSEQGRAPTTNSTHIWHRAGIEPRPHWWEASALITAWSPKKIFVIVREVGEFGFESEKIDSLKNNYEKLK